MRETKRNGARPVADDLIHGIQRREIEADVFELWLGISRLMARVTLPERALDAGTRGKGRSGPPG